MTRSTVQRATPEPFPLQVSPHLAAAPCNDSGSPPAAGVQVVVGADQPLRDRDVPQGPLRRGPFHPGMKCSRGDLHTVRRQRPADRCDPEPFPMFSDERADPTPPRPLRGAHSRTKKEVAALRMQMVCSSSATLRFSTHGPPSPTPPLQAVARATGPVLHPPDPLTQRLRVHPRRPATALIAAHSESFNHPGAPTPNEPPSPASPGRTCSPRNAPSQERRCASNAGWFQIATECNS